MLLDRKIIVCEIVLGWSVSRSRYARNLLGIDPALCCDSGSLRYVLPTHVGWSHSRPLTWHVIAPLSRKLIHLWCHLLVMKSRCSWLTHEMRCPWLVHKLRCSGSGGHAIRRLCLPSILIEIMIRMPVLFLARPRHCWFSAHAHSAHFRSDTTNARCSRSLLLPVLSSLLL